MKYTKSYTENYIKKNYSQMLVKDIQSYLEISYSVIKRTLRKFDIPQKGSGATSLKSISLVEPNISEENDYILGLLVTDGCIQYNKECRQYSIKFASKDQELIDIFSNHFGKVSYDKRLDGVIVVYFGNKKMCEYLISLGITPKKSLTVIYKYLSPHFIRGVFDGDGCVRYNRFEASIASGSYVFLQDIQDYLYRYSIKSTLRKNGKNNNCYGLFINDQKSFKLFYNFLYKDSTLYLKRKYNRFVALLSNEKC